MEINNSLVAILVLVAIVVSIAGTMTTMNVLNQISPVGGDVTGYISGLVNVTVNESAAINFVNFADMNFTLNTRESGLSPVENNTADNSPQAFWIRNDGTTNVNVTIYANDDLWATTNYRTVTDGATNYFQFKCRHNETYCDNSSAADPNSTVTWDAINGSVGNAELVAFNFSYTDGTAPYGDEILIDINVSIPPTESVGEKTSTLVITATTACPGDAGCDSF